jgi:hypothetical protein
MPIRVRLVTIFGPLLFMWINGNKFACLGIAYVCYHDQQAADITMQTIMQMNHYVDTSPVANWTQIMRHVQGGPPWRVSNSQLCKIQKLHIHVHTTMNLIPSYSFNGTYIGVSSPSVPPKKNNSFYGSTFVPKNKSYSIWHVCSCMWACNNQSAPNTANK